MNRKNGHSRLVENIEQIAAALKSVLHGANQVAHAILDRHLGKIAAAASNATALEGTLQLKSQTAVRSRDAHLKAAVTRAALTMATVGLLRSKEVGHLVLAANAVRTGEEHVVAILRLKPGEDLPRLQSLLDEQAANYALATGGSPTVGENVQVVDG